MRNLGNLGNLGNLEGTLGTFTWEPWEPLLGNLGNLGNLGTFTGNLGTLGTFTWEPGNLYLGTFTWNLGTLGEWVLELLRSAPKPLLWLKTPKHSAVGKMEKRERKIDEVSVSFSVFLLNLKQKLHPKTCLLLCACGCVGTLSSHCFSGLI